MRDFADRSDALGNQFWRANETPDVKARGERWAYEDVG